MCTVTYIPTADGVILTSSRDENIHRKPALPPATYSFGSHQLLYPLDAQRGGSWVILKNNLDASILLNGAFVKHERRPCYRLSRGLIFLEIVQADKPEQKFIQINLLGIEPFTLILFCDHRLIECRWDGSQKHRKKLDVSMPYIWSSVTLYNENARLAREQWFINWFNDQHAVTMEDAFHFHLNAGKGDLYNSLVLHRNDMRTQSITSIAVNGRNPQMQYLDLLHKKLFFQALNHEFSLAT